MIIHAHQVRWYAASHSPKWSPKGQCRLRQQRFVKGFVFILAWEPLNIGVITIYDYFAFFGVLTIYDSWNIFRAWKPSFSMVLGSKLGCWWHWRAKSSILDSFGVIHRCRKSLLNQLFMSSRVTLKWVFFCKMHVGFVSHAWPHGFSYWYPKKENTYKSTVKRAALREIYHATCRY